MSDQTGNNCLRCNTLMTDEEYYRQNIAICDKCRPVYFQETPKLEEEEKATLLHGGFDLTEHQILAARQIGPLFVRIWSNGALSLRLGRHPEYFLASDNRQILVDWLAGEL